MDKLLGFLPDADPTVSGVLTGVTNMVPFDQGMKGAPAPVTPLSVPVLAAECLGANVVTKLDGTRRIFAATATDIYELSAGAWVDQSRVAAYTTSGDSRWCLTQFGNDTIAANTVDTLQRSASTGAFADISGAPKARIVFAVGSQVMALNFNDGADKQDGWYCCASYDVTSWTTSLATLCAKGQIVSVPGQITAGGRLGEFAIAYKEKAIYVGQFVGAPAVWDWTQVAGGDAGCVGQDAWCDLGNIGHFIVGAESFFIFDGSRPIPVGDGEVRQWFYDNSDPGFRFRTKCSFDRQTNLVWIFFPGIGSTYCNKALVFHLASKRWGYVDISIESVLNYTEQGLTIDDLPTLSATIDGLGDYSFDSQYWLSGGKALAIFDRTHQMKSMTGGSTTSSMTTGDAGDDDVVTLLSKIRLRFLPGYKPTSATVQTYMKMEEGGSLTNGSTSTMVDGKFDVLDSSRWHRASFTFTGDHRVVGYAGTLTPEGDR